jgi:serine/threonine-protein kinase
MTADPLSLVGTTLDGTYRVDAAVGEGGFGVVYKGYHLGFEQPVAIKCLKLPADHSDATREAFLRKFREEGRLLFQLSQGTLGIVRSIAIGDVVTPSGIWTPFFVLEWLEGQALSADLLSRRQRGLKGRALAQVLALLDLPAKALAHAHSHRVAHRDIKPGNLFVLPEKPGQPPQLKVLDFGIAKVMEEGASAGRAGATRMGFSSFTPQYAAPEQFDPSLGASGPWSDVYSFALLAVELLTDRPPVDGPDAITLMQTTMNPAKRPTPRNRGAAVPDSVEGVFARALAVSPTNRFPDIGAFWDALSTVTTNALSSPVTPPTLPAINSNAFTQGQGFPAQSRSPASQTTATPAALMAMPSPYFQNPPQQAQPLANAQQYHPPVAPPPPASDGPNWAMWVPIGLFILVLLVIVFSGVMCTTCVCVSM